MRSLPFRFGCRLACLEAEAVVSGLKDVAAVGETIEQGGGHFSVAKNRGPFTEAEVGCDDDAGALVKFAQQMEQQRPTGCTERQVSQLIQDGRRSGIDPGDQFPEDGGRAWS